MQQRNVIPRILVASLLLAGSVSVWAHGPTRQKVVESVTLKASPDVAWAKVKDFAALNAWHPAVESATATDGNKPGSVRTLKLKGGGEMVETLESWSAEERSFSYRAKDGGALPVSNYSSTLTVKPADGGGSTVQWRGAFYRAFPNNDPPPEKNDEAAVKAITGVYQSGLANLKTLLDK